MIELLKVIRPRQLPKNILLFAGLIFAQRITDPKCLIASISAFVAFCALSGGAYIFNDLIDLPHDRRHPTKRHRPIASGRLSVNRAIVYGVILTIFAIVVAYLINRYFLLIALLYIVLNWLYSVYLRRQVLIDVIILSSFYLLRVIAGCVAIEVHISPWLILCTLLLALLLGLCKRRGELVELGEQQAGYFRATLPQYSKELLDQFIASITAAVIVAYSLYTFTAHSPAAISKEVPLRPLIATIPVAIYGLFRYLYLVYQYNVGATPELMFKDRHILITLILWSLLVILSSIFKQIL